ncbi:MAG: hypothetical protein ACI9FR_001909 [Cryomorphaceae bacterium]|jgi:hypothetical protein
MKILKLLVCTVLVFCAGCNHLATYESLQRQQHLECDRAPVNDDRSRCKDLKPIVFDDYERERQELLKQQDPP